MKFKSSDFTVIRLKHGGIVRNSVFVVFIFITIYYSKATPAHTKFLHFSGKIMDFKGKNRLPSNGPVLVRTCVSFLGLLVITILHRHLHSMREL